MFHLFHLVIEQFRISTKVVDDREDEAGEAPAEPCTREKPVAPTARQEPRPSESTTMAQSHYFHPESSKVCIAFIRYVIDHLRFSFGP